MRIRSLDLMTPAPHHGVPTRRLDWTRNPRAACGFAVSIHPTNVSVG
ncbi:MAG: FRG domain-containing protein [Acetobacteraceae bacterium]|nr:FRG domain-containing protein [Acetobacteraceae bacterium]